jgi:hypothetical protein
MVGTWNDDSWGDDVGVMIQWSFPQNDNKVDTLKFW